MSSKRSGGARPFLSLVRSAASGSASLPDPGVPYWNLLEPASLVRQFARHPPEGFELLHDGGPGTPAFVAPFDLLTSVDDDMKRRLKGWPLYRWWSRWLRLRRTVFVGTTVSEYALLPRQADVATLPAAWKAAWRDRGPLLIVKDIPQRSPLLDAQANAQADVLAAACAAEGYVLLEGQALAYVPIDFDDVATYVERLPTSRRKNLRRKLRSLESLEVRRLPTGSAFDDERRVDAYYALYLAVYAQSEVHFDKLTRAFFADVLRDARSGGIVFEYRRRGAAGAADEALIGWNLCFESDGKLIDKYIGLAYPAAREHNLYFVSWVVNLGFAVERGLSHYVAGWTDPKVKAQLGASFTFTRHAVFVRNPLLRALGRRFSGLFEGDGKVVNDDAG